MIYQMSDDNVRIRPALPEEASELSGIAWASKGAMEYAPEELQELSSILDISVDFIDENPTYVLENDETGEKTGFYSLVKRSDGTWWLSRLCVVPDCIGSGLGGELFLHACEMAETVGAEYLYAFCGEDSVEFYLHMGAERIEDAPYTIGNREIILPTFRIKL